MSEESIVPGCACDDIRKGASAERRRKIYAGESSGLCQCDACSAAREQMFWAIGITEGLMIYDIEPIEPGDAMADVIDVVLDIEPRFDC